MPAEPDGDDRPGPSLARKILAIVLVLITLVGVWEFINYRTQPPPPPNNAVQER